jgi:hypothetical protein
MAASSHPPVSHSKYTPNGKRQFHAVPKAIAPVDQRPVSSMGNQAIKSAIEHLHLDELQQHLGSVH